MSALAPTLNGLRVITVRLFMLWRGAWVADCELDVDTISQAPTSGPASLVVGGITMKGTVDPRSSGSFVGKASARVVGGAGGWDKVIGRQDYFADNGVLSTTVYQGAGALVGETVKDLAPVQLAPHEQRAAGAASAVFDGVDYFLDALGITNVGARPVATADASLVIRDFDAGEQRVEFSCDTLLYPNTTLSDPRFNGVSPIVRDVEQVFDAQGSHGVAWCSAQPVSRLVSDLQNLIVASCGRTFLRAYRYRLVLYQGGRMALQAVAPTAGVPDLAPVTTWSGLAGAVNMLAPGQEVFVAWDFTVPASPQPIVVGYSLAALPLKTSIDAKVEVQVGPTAPLVQLAGGDTPLALAPWAEAFLATVTAWAAAFGPPSPPTTPVTATEVFALVAALQGALGALAPATTKTVAA